MDSSDSDSPQQPLPQPQPALHVDAPASAPTKARNNTNKNQQPNLMALANIPSSAQSLSEVPQLVDLIRTRRLCFLCCHGLGLVATQPEFDALVDSPPSQPSSPNDDKDDKTNTTPMCTLCLDTLVSLPTLCDSLLTQIAPLAAGYASNDLFRIELVLPRCLAFRRLVFLRTFNYPWLRREWEVKHAVNATLVPFLEHGLGRKHSVDAPLHFTVVFTHDLNSELPDPRSGGGQGQGKGQGEPTPSRREKRKINERNKRAGHPPLPDMHSGSTPFTHLAPVTSRMRQSDLRVRREPIYFGGRYLKLDRPIAQTAWVLDGKRMTELSVGECIGDVVQRVTGASEVVMVAAGREDADVRMVGRGRPFYLEVKNPRCTVVDVERVAKEVNEKWAGKVGVSQLGWVNKSDLKLVKLGEEMKPKTYSCLLWLNRPTRDAIHKVNTTTDLLVHQLTPTRVLHRRPNVVRDKLIHSIELAPVDEAAGFYRAVLKTQAGTYIKEFCHGDFGRTSPSLRTLLGTQVDILELDVVDIDLEWPPIGPATSDGAAENE